MVAWTVPPRILVQKPWLKQNQQGYQMNHQPQQQWSQKGQSPWLPSWPQKGQWGKGAAPQWGKGGGGPQQWGGGAAQWQRKPPPAAPAGLKIDSNARYTGTCEFYAKWKGYGFIVPAESGIVPNDKLFVHWRSVQSDDRFPFLVKGLEVEFAVEKAQDRFNPNIWTLRAKDVTLVGGMNIAVQDDVDAQQKQFVGGQHLRYTGTLKFFNPKLGFGYVTLDQGYDVEPGTPNELRIQGSEVNAGGRNPLFMQNLAVEFGIWKTPRFRYEVYNMTLPGGHPLTQDALENRISMGPQSYRGEVTMWNWRAGWGFLRVDNSMPLPPRVKAKLEAQVASARQRGRTISEENLLYFRRVDCAFGYNPVRAGQVQFQLYVDDKGAGACEVNGL